MHKNETKNQHYISQAEQRLNAINQSAAKDNQRIYAFLVSDREIPELSLRAPKGMLIAKSLSCLDLFSFDVVDHRYRWNFESLFHIYEQDITAHSEALLQKLRLGQTASLETEIVNLFAAKFLNFARSPYCIQKVLNTFGAAALYRPTDPELLEVFNNILHGSRPRQKRVCQEFGLTPDLYEMWLQALFNLLSRSHGKKMNLFESAIKGLFEKHYVMIDVYHYGASDLRDVCLLSDRGFNVPLSTDTLFAFEFNISSRAFSRFTFCDPMLYAHAGMQTEIASRARARVNIAYLENDFESLAKYNQLTACQCAETVYAATQSPRLQP